MDCMGGLEPALERIVYERKPADEASVVSFDEVRRKRRRSSKACFACGVSSEDHRMQHLDKFFYANLGITDLDALYDQLHELFEHEVRAPLLAYNDSVPAEQREPVPTWSKASMRDHYEHHVLNPTVDCALAIRRLRVLIDELFDQVVTEGPNGKRRVSGERLRMLECAMRMLDSRYNANLRDQAFYKASAV